jgi:outer membrane protein
LGAVVTGAPAQTNAPATLGQTNAPATSAAATNAPASAPHTMAPVKIAPVTTNAITVTNMSLQDCIQAGLEHNLDVKIQRFNPELSRLALHSDFGAYDPNFSASGSHSFSQAPGGYDAQGRPYQGTVTDNNSGNAGFSGLAPWGLNYSLQGGLSDSYGANQFGPFENVSGTAGFLRLRQPLLKNAWIDSSRLQIILDRRHLKISELQFRNQVIDTVTAIEEAYYNLIYQQQNVKVQELALELANRLVSENKQRVAAGSMAPFDAQQAESQAAVSRADLLAAQITEDTQQRVLKSLLSDNYSKWLNVSIQPTQPLVALPEHFNLQESWREAFALRPDFLEEKLALEEQGFIVKFQYNQLFPELDLVGTYGYSASSSTPHASLANTLDQFRGRDNPFWSIGGQFSIPLSRISVRNNYRAARLTKEQIALQLKQLQQHILIEVENDIAVATSSFQRVQATRQARIYAQATLDAGQTKLQNGRITSFEVLSYQRGLTAARSAEIGALVAYETALAQLSQAEGATLKRRHLTLDLR